MKKKKIDDNILKFIKKYEKFIKYLVLEEGFVNFEFLIKNGEIKIDLKDGVEKLEINKKIIYYKEYNPLKLIMANMMIQENYLMYTKYDNIMIFVLV